jgi:hypothetical protein
MDTEKIKAVKRFLIGFIICFALIFGIAFAFSKATPNQVSGHVANDTSINSEQAMKEFIKGRWSSVRTYNGMVVYYRFEITENQIQYWERGSVVEWGAEKTEWKSEPEETVTYSLGSVETDSYGNQQRVLAELNCGTVIVQSGKDGKAWMQCVTGGGEDDYFEKGWKE